MTLLIYFIATLLTTGHAEESESKSNSNSFQFRARKGSAIEKFDSSPSGLTKDDVNPPIITLGGQFEVKQDAISNFYLGGDLSFLNSSSPLLYMEGAWAPSASIFRGKAGAALQISSLVSGTPYKHSPLANDSISAFVGAGIDVKILEADVELRFRDVSEAKIGATEGIDTKIEHKPDTIFKTLGSLKLGPLKLSAGYNWFLFGVTAIGSKEFSYRLEEKTLQQSVLGASIHLFMFDVGGYYYELFGVDDEDSHFYRAPHVYPDYLLAKKSFFVEAKCRF